MYFLKVICNGFSQNWRKIVSSCWLQYKPVCVINFDKFTPQSAKKKKFSDLFGIAILRKSSSCVTSYQDALVLFALLLRFDKKCFTRLYFKNPFLRLSVCLCVFAWSVDNIQHSIGCLVVFLVWRHHLRKVNKSSVCSFRHFFYSFLIVWCSSVFI